ncbi:winged helix-turn-helix domain-containing protein [Niabella aurantiaca]|uniref:GntR family transcriptional regulator n=1 Tax=Niabella aurantiaca TaxID=379900 RepID=UPI00035EFB02|nr:winged helix-turn-helix domain-containing protein [Niabella aurantiaca]
MDTKKEDQRIIYIDHTLSIPIYKQIVASVQQGISNGSLTQGDLIPSVNAVAAKFSVARGSIFKAYNELRGMGIIDSVPGKGYFIANARPVGKKNIFLLMSTYNPYREVFYNAFIDKLKNQATVDIYFHHHNIRVFETLIQNHASNYNTFVIMPEIHKQTAQILNQLDQRNIYILDTGLKQFGTLYPCVCQNYEGDILEFLHSVKKRLNHYKRMVLLFSSNMRNYDVITGFERFFAASKQEWLVVQKTEEFIPQRGDLCMVMDDNDLVRLFHFAKKKRWQLGHHLGIISYYDTPLKSIIAEGITTITPDFRQMGISMAEMVLQRSKEHIENPFLLIERASF